MASAKDLMVEGDDPIRVVLQKVLPPDQVGVGATNRRERSALRYKSAKGRREDVVLPCRDEAAVHTILNDGPAIAGGDHVTARSHGLRYDAGRAFC